MQGLNISSIGVFVVMLFISITIHEMMHAFMAYRLGDDLAKAHGRISLNPLNHIDPILTIALPAFFLLLGLPPILAAKPVPINPNRVSGDELGLAAIAFAGPLSNLVLATLSALVLNGIGDVGLLSDLLVGFISLNIALFVFNMLPIPPLDGSRLLYAVAPSSVQRVMDQIEGMGIFIIIALLVLLLPVISPVLQNANEFLFDFLVR